MALPTSEPDIRALEAKCESRASADSTRTVVQLSALPLATRKAYLFAFEDLDLSHLIRCVLEADASPDARLEDFRMPVLVRAALHNHARAVKALLAGGANHALKDETGLTALDAAVNTGSLASLRELLAAGANANALDALGCTPLMVAILRKHGALVRELLPVSDLSITNRQGFTALHVCALSSNVEALELLLPLCNLEVRSVQGVYKSGKPMLLFDETALHVAAECGASLGVVEALLAGPPSHESFRGAAGLADSEPQPAVGPAGRAEPPARPPPAGLGLPGQP